MDFPIEFDIDVEHATKQYVDYTINDIFMKFNALVDAVKSEYDNYKRPETVDKNKKDNMIV
jgi:esterase/lipase